MPASSRGHNSGVFGGDEAAALFASLLTAETLDRVVDAGIVGAVVVVLCWSGYKRPRTTSAVGAVWLLWLLCRLAQGQSAWDDFARHTSHARGATEEAARATLTMLAAWAVLFLPIAEDAERVLSPVAREAAGGVEALWDLMTWQQRGLAALCVLALGGTGVAATSAVAAVQRHKGVVGQVLFQLSFAVCGPALWWATAHLPHEFSGVLVGLAVSFAPTVLTVRALSSLEGERELHGSGYEPLPKIALFSAEEAPEEPLVDKDVPSAGLQRRLCSWLSYWSCWPLFHVFLMIRSAEIVPNETKPAVDGLLLALVAWAQVWEASRIAPYLYTACAGCINRLSEHALEATSSASSSASGLAARLWQAGGAELLNGQGGRWAVVVVAGATALVLASLLLQAMALANALLVLGLLMTMAVDSARCAARGHAEALPPRLAFWVVSTSWIWLCGLPLGIGSLLAAWTPLVLAVAAAAGELLLQAVVRLLRAAGAWLLARRGGGDGAAAGGGEEEGESHEASSGGDGEAAASGLEAGAGSGGQGQGRSCEEAQSPPRLLEPETRAAE